MKKKINNNYFYSSVFVKQLKRLGLKHVCISPGSRNTPLTMAFASERGIKKHIIIDERSSAFFALGIAKRTEMPVAVVTTSGTATAELYPAIIEAYNSRTPLIIITADRPLELIGVGANQTINQKNLYANHIREFVDAGLPKLNKHGLKRLQFNTQKLFETASRIDKGPVHINFPFRKPLEPKSYNAIIDSETYKLFLKEDAINFTSKNKAAKLKVSDEKKILTGSKPLILVGWHNYSGKDFDSIVKLSNELGIPVIADPQTGIRFGKYKCDNLMENANNFLRSDKIDEQFQPDIIIQFGNAPVSNSLLEFFKHVNSHKILVNDFGDKLDPSRTYDSLIKISAESFCNTILEANSNSELNADRTEWLVKWKETNTAAGNLLNKFTEKQNLKFEGKVVRTVIQSLPNNSNLFISNSMPIRDADSFGGRIDKNIFVIANRGASGIDGIISTALGVSVASGKRTFLLTGDLAFFHDMNGLWIANKYKLDLDVILLNNNGGGIFNLLPIAKDNKYFEEYFQTAPGLDFSRTAGLYNAAYHIVNDDQHLTKLISEKTNKGLRILEVRTDAETSVTKRKEFWNRAKKLFDA